MAEYVTEWGECVDDFTVREEVVRCRDCVYRRRSWNGHEPNFIDDWFCSYTGGHEVKPDGFCAWASRKESE